MPLTTYKQVRPWAAAIREAVASRSMPPWHAENNPLHPYRNDRALPKDEVAAIVGWVDGGSREGEPVRPLDLIAAQTEWKLGKPDVVVQIPGFAVPRTGSLPYSFLIVPLHFDHDTWVKAAEFRIDQRAVIHHINAFVRPATSTFLRSFPANQIFVPTVEERGKRNPGDKVFNRRELLLGYEPGYEPTPWLQDGAKLIKAGSDLIFEMHYNPNGKETTDHSEIGLYIAAAAPRNRVIAIDTLRDLDLAIPPGEKDYRSDASMTLAKPVTLLSIQPHMHFRGNSMEVSAAYQDGRTEQLLRVPRYDFRWQTTYVFRNPVLLPAGTKLKSKAAFDNSANNKFNPGPDKTVHWGDQTIDEMHIAFLDLIIAAEVDTGQSFRGESADDRYAGK